MSCGKKAMSEELEAEQAERYQEKVDNWVAKTSLCRNNTYDLLNSAEDYLLEIQRSARLSYAEHVKLCDVIRVLQRVLHP